jgi:hypothetical protein
MDPTTFLDRRPRLAVRLTATIRRADGARLPVPVSDVSPDGCCVGAEFGIGEWQALELPELGEVRSQVRWSVNGRSGLRFGPEA